MSGSFLVEISCGELFDKITILEIKSKHFSEPDRLANIKTELELLKKTRDSEIHPSQELSELVSELAGINERLWQIEDDIRIYESKQDFGPQFIDLARNVYRTNDERSRVKREINNLVGSRIQEEKSYSQY